MKQIKHITQSGTYNCRFLIVAFAVGVGFQLLPKHYILRAPFSPKPPTKLHHQIDQHNLGFILGKEPPRAGVLAMPKDKLVW